MGSAIWDLLPLKEGLLPNFLGLIAIVSVGSTISAFSSVEYTQELYEAGSASSEPAKPTTGTRAAQSGSAVTPLTSHLFAIWTLLSGLIRFKTACNISNGPVYDLCIASFALAFLHFNSELFLFRTAKMNKRLVFPEIIATGSLVWMVAQRGYYLSLSS